MKSNVRRKYKELQKTDWKEVNSEIWDIAQKTTLSMDARLQKVQVSLVKGIVPIARGSLPPPVSSPNLWNLYFRSSENWDIYQVATLMTPFY